MNVQKLVLVFAILAFVTLANASKCKDNPHKKYTSKLTYDYYKHSCPNVEAISKEITESFVYPDPTLAAGLIRMDFHDCIVRGCDASVLLDPTPSNNETEKDALPNSTLRGFEVVNAIKEKLEEVCPGVVSCADVLRLASRDAVVAVKGPYWDVTFGRRDGVVSLGTEALAQIPSPFSNITTLKGNFAAVGLNSKDLAVLSGAHTIGTGHCFIIRNRLYNFTGKGDTDPSLNPHYAKHLKTLCLPILEDPTTVPMDPYTPGTFDEKYFTAVTRHKGLFQSDEALLNDRVTRHYVKSQVYTKGKTFAKDFAWSMSKMIEIGVLTGYEGEIRKTCGAVNSY